MNSSKPKLSINNLSKSYEDSNLKVLDNISLSVNKGEIVSIIGPSGCGKSTLLDCIARLTSFDGDIQIDGGTSYMFQDDMMFPWRTVLDNVILPLEIAGQKKEKARAEAETLLKEFGLNSYASYYPFMLSGGMRERASLLRTYLSKKDIMLMDEPFSKLDALTRQEMQQWFLNSIYTKQKSVLFVTHDIDEAIYLSDRIYVFSKRPGKIVGEILVNIRKPRSINIVVNPEFVGLKKRILHYLKK